MTYSLTRPIDRHISILPSVEVASELRKNYAQNDFVKNRVLDLIHRYLTPQPDRRHPRNASWPAVWAKVYDQHGQPRYAVQLIGVASNKMITGHDFVSWLDTLAESVSQGLSAPIGFMIDPGLEQTMVSNGMGYTPKPGLTPASDACSFLAIQGFISEIQTPELVFCNATPYCDNNGLLPADHPPGADNKPNREQIAADKRKRLAGWIGVGLPVVVDVNPGYDGHYIFGGVVPHTNSCTRQAGCVIGICASDNQCHFGTGYWGDNAFYYDDYFRNYMSQLRGMGNVGITFNSWNQYTEGSVAVPAFRVPFPNIAQGTGHWDSVQFNWLKDIYATGSPTA